MHPQHRDKFSSLKRRRTGENVAVLEPPRRLKKKKASAKNKKSKWRIKRPADEIPPLHPHALYRPGRLCALFDIDKSTLTRWRKQGKLPPYIEVAGVKGLTGQQILDFYAQGQSEGQSDA